MPQSAACCVVTEVMQMEYYYYIALLPYKYKILRTCKEEEFQAPGIVKNTSNHCSVGCLTI